MINIKAKKYLRIEFTLASPLIIGCGKNENTDNDVLINNIGVPYIPGTAIAGVIRDEVSGIKGITEADIKDAFGEVEGETIVESKLIFYDANIKDAHITQKPKFNISVRDSVALDEYKTAREGAKFDMEVLEPGVDFVTYIELSETKDSATQEKVWDAIKSVWNAGNIKFGAKTTRGMGAVKDIKIKEVIFDFSDKEKITEWIDFDMHSESWPDGYAKIQKTDIQSGCEILLSLELLGGISIRRYSTEVSTSDTDAAPDYGQLTVKNLTDENDEIPVIPGTTWAGAFRHRIQEFLQAENKVNDYFGKVVTESGKSKEKYKSKIIFSESQIKGGTFKNFTRNAIDRFTGGAADGALYTEKTYYGGETELKITLKSESVDEEFKNALAATIADLHGGYLAVGGLTAVGRGIFRVIGINGKSDGIEDASAEDIYKKISEIIKSDTVNDKEAD